MKQRNLTNSIFQTVKYPMPPACRVHQRDVFPCATGRKKRDSGVKIPPLPNRLWIFILLPAIWAVGLTTSTPGAASSSSNDTEAAWSFASFGKDDYFHRPSDIAVDPEYKRIYVADSGNHRVVTFDFEGKHLNSIGHEGQGPGEFSLPTGLCILPDSDLAVADFGNTRIQIFGRDGEFKRVIGTHGIKAADIIMHEGLFFTVPSFGESGFALNFNSEETTQPVLTVIDLQGGKVRDILVDDFPENQPFVRALKHRVCMALSPDGRLFLSYSYMNLTQVFDLKGNKLTQFDRLLPFKPMTPRLIEEQNDGGVIRMRASLDQVSPAAQFGPDGRLYLLTCAASSHKLFGTVKNPEDRPPLPMRIDVIDPKTLKIVDEIACDSNVRAFSIMDTHRLITIFEDPDGELTLKCTRI